MADDKVRLVKPVSSMTTEALQKYIDAHLPGGDKRELAVAVLELRKKAGK